MNRITIGEESSRTNREKEVYRTLRTNIEFTGVENRAIAITSCTPNDGKTTVSYNLACAFADGGKKTLLVDADLRKSVLFHRLQVQDSVKGLSHYLSGQGEHRGRDLLDEQKEPFPASIRAVSDESYRAPGQ